MQAAPYYRVYRNGEQVSADYFRGTQISVDLPADGAYAFTVAAEDAAGNIAQQSFPMMVTRDTQPPTATAMFTDVTGAGSLPYSFSVTYTDNVALEDAQSTFTLAAEVVGPDGTIYTTNGHADSSPQQPAATLKYFVNGLSFNTTAADGTYHVLVQPYEVGDKAGNYIPGEEIGTFTVAVPPAAPEAGTSDTGPSNMDGVTRLDNSSSTKRLSFSVFDADPKATTYLYADGALIGTGRGATVTSDGVHRLSEGAHAITVQQKLANGVMTPVSPATTMTVDTTPPHAVLVPVRAGIANGSSAINWVVVAFNEPVFGRPDLVLTRNGSANLIPSGQYATTTGNNVWTLDGLADLTSAPGTYSLLLNQGSTVLIDNAGNGVAYDPPLTWSASSGVTTLTGTPVDDNFNLRRDSDGTDLDIWIDSGDPGSNPPTVTVPLGTFNAISAGAGDDTVTLDLSNGNLNASNSGFTIDGGDGTNTLRIVGTSASETVDLSSLKMASGSFGASYTGISSITYDTGGGSDSVYVTGNVPVTLAKPQGPVTISTLSIGAGSTVIAPSALQGAPSPLVVGKLTISGTGNSLGVLDLRNNDLIARNGDLGALSSLLASGRNVAPGGVADGTWNGSTGIASSAAAARDARDGQETVALGIARNGDLPLGAYTTFDGVSVGAADVLIKYTYTGDLNLDGQVDNKDVAVFAGFYDGGITTTNGWMQGDLNGDGKVDGRDVAILAGFFGTV